MKYSKENYALGDGGGGGGGKALLYDRGGEARRLSSDFALTYGLLDKKPSYLAI